MPPESVDALVECAHEGISFDGLTVDVDGETFIFETPETSQAGVSAGELKRVATDSPYVTNWYFWHETAPQREESWTFLRWLEGAPIDSWDFAGTETTDADGAAQGLSVPDRYTNLEYGIFEQWGELLLSLRLGTDGSRRYEIRHIDDAEVDGDSLTGYTDPKDARERAMFDDRGQYRPLKTAPTLQTGWIFEDLGPAELVTAIDFFYPATVENWYRERMGVLDITHWKETMARQTGLYSVNQTWDRGEGHEHAEWVAGACCDDSQCLKRREWQYDEETRLAVDGGSGTFPCREPCSLVISATRKWTRLEGEASRTYEFELTPSEKEQLEAIIDAVADGRTDEIREADFRSHANRYRTRFLREKLFDDAGNLCGALTADDSQEEASGDWEDEEVEDEEVEDEEVEDGEVENEEVEDEDVDGS